MGAPQVHQNVLKEKIKLIFVNQIFQHYRVAVILYSAFPKKRLPLWQNFRL
jgi:hypothetical protein